MDIKNRNKTLDILPQMRYTFRQRAGVMEWQTQRIQNPPMATSCGFESHHRHQDLLSKSADIHCRRAAPHCCGSCKKRIVSNHDPLLWFQNKSWGKQLKAARPNFFNGRKRSENKSRADECFLCPKEARIFTSEKMVVGKADISRSVLLTGRRNTQCLREELNNMPKSNSPQEPDFVLEAVSQ